MLRPAALVASVALAVCALADTSSGQELRWRSGALATRAAERPRARLVRQLEGGAARHVLVRFERSPGELERATWSAAGLTLGRALGNGAFFARVDPGRADARALARLRGLVDVREVELGWKLHPELLAGGTPSWTVVRDGREAGGDPTVAVYALLHDGEALELGDALLRRHGGTTFDVLESVNGLVALLPRSRVSAFAGEDAVLWVEPALPQMDGVSLAANDSNRAIIQANTLQAAPYSLSGAGVSVLVYDAGTARATHNDFGGRLTSRDGSGLIDHATHVAATVGGSGAASGGTFRGMAPGVTIESYGFQYDGSGTFLFSNPGDFENDYASALALGVDIANNSIGSNVEPNGFACSIQGDYGVMSSLIDAVVGGSLGQPYRIVWANGNERQGSRCDVEGFGDYYSIAPPAGAKNHITVGALNSNDDSMTAFSSWGPTDDGRMKPDISGPGCQSNGDGGVTSAGASSNTSYVTFCGTSMASPTVCGIAALVLEDYRAQFGGPDPLNSTLKVLLAQTALDRGNPGPDYQFGYGSVRAQTAVDFMRLGRFLEEGLAGTSDNVQWTVVVPPGASELRLTLAWDDAPGTPNVLGSLVNDLDLVVRDPLAAQHHVWTLNPAAPASNAVRTAANRRDNLEQVLVTSPIAGTWTVEVLGFDVPEGPQTFSLASSHDLVPEPRVKITLPGGLPAVLDPGVATPVVARIEGLNDTVVPGSPTLHVRYDGGPFLSLPLAHAGGDDYTVDLPPAACGAEPEFWFSAEGATSGPASSPATAPASTYAALVYSVSTVLQDDFDTDTGWTVENVSLTAGAWQRGAPIGGGTRGDPATAFGGSGQCWLTQNGPGDTDVDGGPTRLVSPLFDLTGGGTHDVSYARWFTNDDADIDRLTVEVSDDGGASWTLVESVPGAGAAWIQTSFHLEDLVAATSQVRVRFSAADQPNDSVTEAGIDAFRIERRSCAPLPDCNGNGIVDSDDIASGRSLDADTNGIPDECGMPTGGKFQPGAPTGTAPDRAGP